MPLPTLLASNVGLSYKERRCRGEADTAGVLGETTPMALGALEAGVGLVFSLSAPPRLVITLFSRAKKEGGRGREARLTRGVSCAAYK